MRHRTPRRPRSPVTYTSEPCPGLPRPRTRPPTPSPRQNAAAALDVDDDTPTTPHTCFFFFFFFLHSCRGGDATMDVGAWERGEGGGGGGVTISSKSKTDPSSVRVAVKSRCRKRNKRKTRQQRASKVPCGVVPSPSSNQGAEFPHAPQQRRLRLSLDPSRPDLPSDQPGGGGYEFAVTTHFSSGVWRVTRCETVFYRRDQVLKRLTRPEK